MYKKLPNLVLGFHGCDRKAYENVLYRHQPMRRSTNVYDWLGNGTYFWEQNLQRAWEWASNRYGEKDARVIGAVIDLGFCLNLTDFASTSILKVGYSLLKVRCLLSGTELPHNRSSKKTNDILLRDLDCAVIEQVHDYRSWKKLPPYDSVRGIFLEGRTVYPGSEFREKTHVQICVRNPNCIKGLFNPITENERYPMP